MKKILFTITVLMGIILPTQAFAASDSYINFLNTSSESYAVKVQLNENENATIQYSYASDSYKMCLRSSVNIDFDEKGIGTFNYEDVTGVIDLSNYSMTIKKR